MMLAGKVCLITGATRGIGWATAETLAQHGAILVLNSRSPEALDQCRTSIVERYGTPVSVFAADAGDAKAVDACYQNVFRQYKKLDVLVNNAGVMRDAFMGMISDDLASSVMRTNVLGSLFHAQGAARLMRRARKGSIVNIASIIGRFGKEGQTVYASSKAAVIGMTLAAARELAPQGIRVNAVAPGMIDTDLTRELPPALRGEALASIRMGRIGLPSEVANTILFLASEMSSYVTGQVIGVDGGMSV